MPATGAAPETMSEKDIAWMQEELATLAKLAEEKEHELIEVLEAGKGGGAVKALEDEIDTIVTKRDAYAKVVQEKLEQYKKLDTASKRLTMVVYTSTQSTGMNEEDIAMITARSVTKNRMLGVTGVLAFSVATGQFIQILEGEEQTVDTLYQRIARDTRHTNVALVRKQQIEARRFPEWPMFSLDLLNYDPAEQPLHTMFHVLAQNNCILSQCSQKCMKDVLIKGGNPLFVQPKRRHVVTMLVGLHNVTQFSMLRITPQCITDTFDTFSKTVETCVTAYSGTVVNSKVGYSHAQWDGLDIPKARDAMQTIIDTFNQRRLQSILPHDAHAIPKSKLPEVPLLAHGYPCVALSCGDVFITPVTSSHHTLVDVVGPAVEEAEEMLATARREGLQMLMSRAIRTRIEAYLKSYHVEDVIPLGKTMVDACFTLREVPHVPKDLPESLQILAAELGDMHLSFAIPTTVEAEAEAEKEATQKAAAEVTAVQRSEAAKELVPNLHLLHHPPPPKSYSDRVFLTHEELVAQFDVLDVNKNGRVSRLELNKYCQRFDSMGLDAGFDHKIQRLLGERQELSFDEFSILMLRMAQD